MSRLGLLEEADADCERIRAFEEAVPRAKGVLLSGCGDMVSDGGTREARRELDVRGRPPSVCSFFFHQI